MKLYYSDVLSPRKACAVAKHLKLPVELIYLELGKGEHLQPDYLAINPNGKVPTLVDGDQVLWEADAIMCALARRAESDLWPQDTSQVEIIRWFSWALQYITKDAGTLREGPERPPGRPPLPDRRRARPRRFRRRGDAALCPASSNSARRTFRRAPLA